MSFSAGITGNARNDNVANVKIVSGGADITEFLNMPMVDGNGVIDLTKATVKVKGGKSAFYSVGVGKEQ